MTREIAIGPPTMTTARYKVPVAFPWHFLVTRRLRPPLLTSAKNISSRLLVLEKYSMLVINESSYILMDY